MDRFLKAVLFVGLATSMAGCTLCQSTEDYTYAAYGGQWPRHDRLNGRVGSILSDTAGGSPEMGFSDVEFSDRGSTQPSPVADQAAQDGLYQGIDDPPPPPPPHSR